ncbi:MAG: lipopolysaccharide biosynthesis protein [Anaerolineae bacterium]|nr:lipopolysaccharide biosynthesis protein [Anaerolineae bacterium]
MGETNGEIVTANLRKQATKGMFWVTVARIATRALSFAATLILARLLVPDDFGLVWVADLAVNAFLLLQEMGLGAALIYRKDRLEEAANTAFFAMVGGSLFLYLVALLTAPYLAAVFSKDPIIIPQIIPILRVLSLTLVISALGRVPQALLAKEMDFKRKIMPGLLGGLIGASVSIALALTGFGVTAIVLGRLCSSVVSAATVWFFVDWRPALSFDLGLAREMLGYAKHILASQVMVFFITNIDDGFVSRLLGTAALGEYGLAYKISNTPATEISRLVSEVMFPTFSKVGDDRERMKRIYLRTTRYVAMLSVPLSLAIIAFAEYFVYAAYGRKWEGAIVPMQLLGAYGMLRSIAVNMGSVFKASGKPKWLLYIATWRLVTMAALLYPATMRWGVVGVSALSAIVAVVDFGISVTLVNRIIGARALDYVKMLGPIFIFSSIATAISRWAAPYLYDLLGKTYFSMPVCGVILAVVYGSLLWITDSDLRETVRTFWHDWLERRRRLAERAGNS